NAEERVFPDYRKVVDSGADIFLSHDRMTIDFMRGNGHKTILAQGGVAPGMICVYCDDLSAGSLAAEHAFDKGHRLAGMIFPSTESSRFTGFIDSFTKLGGVVPDKFKWVFPFNHRILEERVAAKIADAERLPTIFYCFADNIMFPVIRAFTTKGLRVPDDVSLIGTDNLYWGAYNKPAFTTVDLNEALFADKLIEAIGHAERNGAPYQLAVPVRLLERETVKRIYGRKVGGQESGVANSPAIKCLEERKYQVSRS
ncbi:MAG: LacI family DNA-binding transcriptional regulator, partial [Victivallales bacterium]|nr:LacI family DNA-binding transcriptional regulator [Victivallales bacterium]